MSDEGAVVVASFPSRTAAERMLASLGRGFRKKARRGDADAFVVHRNSDGSLKLTEARAVTRGGLISALIHVGTSVAVGFTGIFSASKEVRRWGHSVHVRQKHVGAEDQKTQAIIDSAGPEGAIALVVCADHETRQAVVDAAAEQANDHWDASSAEFLADLDPGPKHDWVRSALGVPTDSSSGKR